MRGEVNTQTLKMQNQTHNGYQMLLERITNINYIRSLLTVGGRRHRGGCTYKTYHHSRQQDTGPLSPVRTRQFASHLFGGGVYTLGDLTTPEGSYPQVMTVDILHLRLMPKTEWAVPLLGGVNH